MLSIITKITLARPYNQSVYVLYKLVNVWGFDLLSSGTDSSIAVIGIPWDAFIKIFGEAPETNRYKVPIGTENFIKEVEVIEVIEKGEEK